MTEAPPPPDPAETISNVFHGQWLLFVNAKKQNNHSMMRLALTQAILSQDALESLLGTQRMLEISEGWIAREGGPSPLGPGIPGAYHPSPRTNLDLAPPHKSSRSKPSPPAEITPAKQTGISPLSVPGYRYNDLPTHPLSVDTPRRRHANETGVDQPMPPATCPRTPLDGTGANTTTVSLPLCKRQANIVTKVTKDI
ncbi:hypothetical protein PCASD_24307 [Puccinia coronata f. sp. avenae]|uniref:Uncharacterized protein n=1 Tax=Puccinia coronata f. sp. avenae TaxID=200324 RepID=A0A2N5S9D9_9BASI|nr:hypothetical protein PCASD_24307 [Puccinia coronata f. sp. avenae]